MNVVRGEMSFVGPRPERPEFVELFGGNLRRADQPRRVRPGITGWSQLKGLTGRAPLAERVRWDDWYVENWSLWLDVKIAADDGPRRLSQATSLAAAERRRRSAERARPGVAAWAAHARSSGSSGGGEPTRAAMTVIVVAATAATDAGEQGRQRADGVPGDEHPEVPDAFERVEVEAVEVDDGGDERAEQADEHDQRPHRGG